MVQNHKDLNNSLNIWIKLLNNLESLLKILSLVSLIILKLIVILCLNKIYGLLDYKNNLKKENHHKLLYSIYKVINKTFTLKLKEKLSINMVFYLKLLKQVHLKSKVELFRFQQELLFKWIKKLVKLFGKSKEIILNSNKRHSRFSLWLKNLKFKKL